MGGDGSGAGGDVVPPAEFEAKNKVDFFGLAVFDTIKRRKNNTTIFFDEAASSDQAAALAQ